MFYIGTHRPTHAQHFERSFISIRVLRNRRKDFQIGRRNRGKVIVDSSAFTELDLHGCFQEPVSEYAEQLRSLRRLLGRRLEAAISQDYMCEPRILARTGLTIPDHQRLTIERYDDLVAARTGVLIIPVLQGFAPQDYVSHIRQYGTRLRKGMWVGVGSVCKRNGDPAAILAVLEAIHAERPDLRLHGFGLKKTALANASIVKHLHSSDSMSWSFHARINGRGPDANDWREADRFRSHIEHLITGLPQQIRLIMSALQVVA